MIINIITGFPGIGVISRTGLYAPNITGGSPCIIKDIICYLIFRSCRLHYLPISNPDGLDIVVDKDIIQNLQPVIGKNFTDAVINPEILREGVKDINDAKDIVKDPDIVTAF